MESITAKRHCGLFIARKRRYCKMIPNPGEIYCNQHMPADIQLPNGRKRVLCPLDPKHSCFEDELKSHLSRCNAREKSQPVFYQENINLENGNLTSEDETILKVSIKDVPTEKLINVLDKLNKAFNEKVDAISVPLVDLMSDSEKCHGTETYVNLKHSKQNEALLNILKHYNLIRNDMAFIELGAGRGRLTYQIIQDLKPTSKSLFILVDRASQRHKFDNKYIGSDEIRIERIKIDIKHLNLMKLSSLQSCAETLMISKHLCGSATDLALRCFTNYHIAYETNNKAPTCKFVGSLIALCCHHCCEWETYVGKKFLSECGFNAEEFDILLRVSSWATCGTRKDKIHVSSTENHRLDITDIEQENYGIKSKRLIDQGRIEFLKKHNLKANLLHYTDKLTSLENVALLITT